MNIVRSLDKVNALECFVWNNTSAMTGLGAVSNFNTFRFADGSRGWLRNCIVSIASIRGLEIRTGAKRQKSSAELDG